MSLIPAHRLVDTVLTWVHAEREILDTIIDQHLPGRRLHLFKGLRASIPENALPSLEVAPDRDAPGWEFVRVQGDSLTLQLHLTTPVAGDPQANHDLESRLASFITRILCYPSLLRAPIQGTPYYLQDSFPGRIAYNVPGFSPNLRVTIISWTGSILVPVPDSAFEPDAQFTPERAPGDYP